MSTWKPKVDPPPDDVIVPVRLLDWLRDLRDTVITDIVCEDDSIEIEYIEPGRVRIMAAVSDEGDAPGSGGGGSGAEELSDLGDADAPAPADWDLLRYNAGAGQWENVTILQVLEQIDGYSASDHQMLVNDNGSISWVNTEECST